MNDFVPYRREYSFELGTDPVVRVRSLIADIGPEEHPVDDTNWDEKLDIPRVRLTVTLPVVQHRPDTYLIWEELRNQYVTVMGELLRGSWGVLNVLSDGRSTSRDYREVLVVESIRLAEADMNKTIDALRSVVEGKEQRRAQRAHTIARARGLVVEDGVA